MKFRYVIFMLLAVPIIVYSLKISAIKNPPATAAQKAQKMIDAVYKSSFMPAIEAINTAIQAKDAKKFRSAFSQGLSAFRAMQYDQAKIPNVPNPNIQNATFVLLQKLKSAEDVVKQEDLKPIYAHPDFIKLIINALGEFEKSIQVTPQGAQNLLKQLHDLYTYHLDAKAQGEIRMYLNVSTFDEWYNQQKNNIDAAIQAQQATA